MQSQRGAFIDVNRALPGTIKLDLMKGRTNTGLVLDATGGSGLFKITATPGTSLYLEGEAAQDNTKTDYVLFEAVLPQTYQPGTDVTLTANAAHVEASGATLTNTLDCEAWLMADDGTGATDLCITAVQAVGTGGDLSFIIDGATLSPGAKLLIRLTSVATEGANAGTTKNLIKSVRLS